MKKLIALVMALAMFVMPMAAQASAATELLAQANAQGKLVTAVTEFKLGDIPAAMLDAMNMNEETVALAKDVVSAMNLTVYGQDNQIGLALGLGENYAATAVIEFADDSIYITSDWLPTQLVITGDDLKYVMDAVMPLIEQAANEDAQVAQLYNAFVKPVLSEIEFTIPAISLIQMFADMKAMDEQLTAMLTELLASMEGAFPKTEAAAAKYTIIEPVTIDGVEYSHVNVEMDAAAMMDVVGAVCDDLAVNPLVDGLVQMIAAMSGEEVTTEQVMTMVRDAYNQVLSTMQMNTTCEMIVDEPNNSVISMFSATTMMVEDQAVSYVVRVDDSMEGTMHVVTASMDFTMGIDNVMTMIFTDVEDVVDYSEAVTFSLTLGEAMTGLADASIKLEDVTVVDVLEDGNVMATESADLYLGAGFGGTENPVFSVMETVYSSDPVASVADAANAVHATQVDDAWVQSLQENAGVKLFQVIDMLPESVLNVLMAQ